MSGKRIGERLSNLVPLSGHDIEEILSEQDSKGGLFGDIALKFGLCQPEHLWRALCGQLEESPQKVNLSEFGIDSQAVEHFPVELALRFHAIPVRILGDEMVIAVDEAAYPEVAKEIIRTLHIKARFVLTTHQQIAHAIRTYYTHTPAV